MTSNAFELTAEVIWPRGDYSRVPYWLYCDERIYALEMEKIFRGPTWSFVGFEAEVPKVGDFRQSFVGDTPVLLSRAEDGTVHVLVNRCAHRGAIVRREPYGNAKDHTCIYHCWLYGLDGSLRGVPFRRGVKGKGGLAADFDMDAHGLQRLRVQSLDGILFATFSDKVEPVEAYLGERITAHLRKLMSRPIRILGYQRQKINGNWKLYSENTRDTYHGSLLHEFQSTFGISRATQEGGTTMDRRHRHNLTWAKTGTDAESEAAQVYAENRVHDSKLHLRDAGIIQYHPDFADRISLAICSIFPGSTFHLISNSLAGRRLRPCGVGAFELHFTLFGYQDDSEAMHQHRLVQANMVGPAGLISMEDGEAVEITYRAALAERDACSVLEMGGAGPIADLDHRVQDVPVRGFWSFYSELMGIERAGAQR